MGVYKNAFDAKDGTLKKNLVAKDMNTQGVSSNIRAISGTLSHKPVSTQETITESAREAKSVIERVIGERASVVITNDSAQNRAFYNPNEGVIYINNKADLSGEDVAKFVAMHEITHTTEGTKYYDELEEVLVDISKDASAPQALKDKIGDLKERQGKIGRKYEEQLKNQNVLQQIYTVETERNADLIGELLGNDYYINKLADRNLPLLKKLFLKIKGLIKKSADTDSASTKYLNKLASKFAKAIDYSQGGVKISQLGPNEDEEKDIEQSEVKNERYSFAGKKARISNKLALATAQNRIVSGEDAETVRRETGWFKGYDGEWRFEIDDSKMDVALDGKYSRNPDIKRYAELLPKVHFEESATQQEIKEFEILWEKLENVSIEPKYIGDIVHHPELFKAYPELQDIKVIFVRDYNSNGSYHPGFNEITISESIRREKTKLKNTLIHELQHAVQEIEGFGKGSSPEYWNDKKMELTTTEQNQISRVEKNLNKVRRKTIEKYGVEANGMFEKYFEYDQLYMKGDDVDEKFAQRRMLELENKIREKQLLEPFAEFSKAYTDLESTKQEIKKNKRSKSSFLLYQNTAGEIEARDSERRIELTAEERKSTRPDIDRTDVVFAEDSTVSKNFVGWNANGNEIYQTSQNTKNMTISQRISDFKHNFLNIFRGKTVKFERNGHIYYAQFSNYEKEVKKLIYEGSSKSDRPGYNAKVRLLVDGDIISIVEDSKYKHSKLETGKNTIFHRNAFSWDYLYKTIVVDGKGYDIVVDIRNDVPNKDFSKKSQLVYSVKFYENKNVATSVTIPANSKAHVNLDVTTTDSISEKRENVNDFEENNDVRYSKASSEPEFVEAEDGVGVDFGNPLDEINEERHKKVKAENQKRYEYSEQARRESEESLLNSKEGKLEIETRYEGDIVTDEERLTMSEAQVKQRLEELTARDKFAGNKNKVLKMESVFAVTGEEFAKGELDLVTQVDEYFKTFNYRVYNKEVGKVLIDKRGIKDDIAHGIERKKAATFAAVPDVIKNGKVVDYQKNWKGRGYDTAAIAAPIIIANEKHYMGVVVIRNKENNRFYVHEVATIKEEGAQPFKTSLAENNSNAGGDTPSIISILQNLAKNSPSYEKNSIYTKKGAVRSLVLQAIDSLFNDGKSDDVAFILNDAKNDIVSFSK